MPPKGCQCDPKAGEKLGAILLMEEILHQLRLVVYPTIYMGFIHSQVVLWDIFHPQYHPDVL